MTPKEEQKHTDLLPCPEEMVEQVKAAIYDAFHNMTLPSMAGKFKTMGDSKDYVEKLVLAALARATNHQESGEKK